MPADSTLIQLFLFRQGTRKIEIMNDVAKDLTDDDLRKFGDYFAKLPPPKGNGSRRSRPSWRARRRRPPRTTARSCHNPDFSGRDQMPRLAGQREDYLLKAMRDYKSKQRPGYEPTMDEVMRPVTDAEIVDLSHYLARLNETIAAMQRFIFRAPLHTEGEDHGLDHTDPCRDLHRT